MMSERTLRKWRKEALEFRGDIKDMKEAAPTMQLINEILRMTQELLDQHLINKK